MQMRESRKFFRVVCKTPICTQYFLWLCCKKRRDWWWYIYIYGVNFIHENDDEHQFIKVLNELSKDDGLRSFELSSGKEVVCVKKYNEKHNGRISKRYKLNNKFVGKLKVNTLFWRYESFSLMFNYGNNDENNLDWWV